MKKLYFGDEVKESDGGRMSEVGVGLGQLVVIAVNYI